ncbi:MAG: flagellar basal body-associated protein FliL [Campylobacterota bacterium]|nr:flagellar basal body-associated protein FliL [Campylobacterota bacterium]
MAEEETTESTEEAPKEKKSGSLVLIIIIVVLILVILIGAVIAILMMGGDDEEAVQSNAPVAKERSVNNNQNSQRLTSGSGRTSGSFSEIGPMFPLDNFTVNLLSESGRRYLKVQMNLELSGEELGAELDTRKAVIRDIIIRLLSSKSLEEISTSKGKEKLKDQIVDQLNMRLQDGQINNVYFTEFVVQ